MERISALPKEQTGAHSSSGLSPSRRAYDLILRGLLPGVLRCVVCSLVPDIGLFCRSRLLDGRFGLEGLLCGIRRLLRLNRSGGILGDAHAAGGAEDGSVFQFGTAVGAEHRS